MKAWTITVTTRTPSGEPVNIHVGARSHAIARAAVIRAAEERGYVKVSDRELLVTAIARLVPAADMPASYALSAHIDGHPHVSVVGTELDWTAA